MGTGRLFWGVLLITVGLLFFLGHVLEADIVPDAVWNAWPLVLILWGAARLTSTVPLKLTLVVLSALLLGMVFYSIFGFSWIHGNPVRHHTGPLTERFNEPFSPGTTSATLSLDCAAGSFTLRSPTDALIEGSAESNIGRYALERIQEGSRERLSLTFDGDGRNSGLSGFRNTLSVALHPEPVWDLDIDVGASRSIFDLSGLKVRTVKLGAGAAKVTLTLGTLCDDTHVTIDAGVTSLRVEVPETAGCEVYLSTGLSRKRLPGFERILENTFRTENFNEATSRISMDIDAGVSSIRVVRY